MARLLRVLISAVWPVLAVALGYVAEWMVAFGPDFLVQGWIGLVLRAGLWFAALAAVMHGAFRHRGWIVIVSMLVMVFALITVMLGVQDWVLQQRGGTTECTVVDVEKEEVTEHHSDGGTTTTTYYIHHLDCTTAEVQTLTTPQSPSAEVGERVAVLYDPQQRVGPRLSRDMVDPRVWLQVCLVCVGLFIVLRAGSELIDDDQEEREPDERPVTVLGGFAFDVAFLAMGLLFVFLLVVALRAAGWVTDAVLGPAGPGDTWLRLLLQVPLAVALVALVAYLVLVRGGRLLARLLAAIPDLSWSERVQRELLLEFLHAVERRFRRRRPRRPIRG